ncbi:MAG TPA: CAP domain-containing protein [Allocoleopsis sp.]
MYKKLVIGTILGTIAIGSSAIAYNLPLKNNENSAQNKQELIISQNAELERLENLVHQQINDYRKSKRLPPLTMDNAIREQCRIHSQNMANKTVRFSHDGFKNRLSEIRKVLSSYRAGAENVAYNQGYKDPDVVAVKGWIKSPGHKANIQGKYNLTGIGVAKNAKGEYYFTQIFIQTK